MGFPSLSRGSSLDIYSPEGKRKAMHTKLKWVTEFASDDRENPSSTYRFLSVPCAGMGLVLH